MKLRAIENRRRKQTLTVALPRTLAGLPESISAGKMWAHLSRELQQIGCDIEYLEPRRRGRFGRRPDVWLIDGHLGSIEANAPVVAHLHEAPWVEGVAEHHLDPEFCEAGRTASDAATRQASMVITPSEFSREQVVRVHGVAADRVRAVPHGVDRRMFNPSRRSGGEDFVRRHGVSGPYVLFVSVLHPRKNVAVLRDAMTMLAGEGLPHALIMVVSPAADRQDYDSFLVEASAPLPNRATQVVTLMGLSEVDLASVMAGASALCAPSLSEGFGLTPLEAMASGTPVVVSNRGALPEVVGSAGLVVEPNADAIASALRSVLSDDRLAKTLGEAGRLRSELFTWESAARGWLAVLEEASRS